MSESFITREQAEKALEQGKRVQFHWRDETTEINKETSFEDLRWNLRHKNAVFCLTVNDVVNGSYSIIN